MLPYTHWCYFPTRAAARRCADDLPGYTVHIKAFPDATHPWLLRAQHHVSEAAFTSSYSWRDEVKTAVARHGGLYDGGEPHPLAPQESLLPGLTCAVLPYTAPDGQPRLRLEFSGSQQTLTAAMDADTARAVGRALTEAAAAPANYRKDCGNGYAVIGLRTPTTPGVMLVLPAPQPHLSIGLGDDAARDAIDAIGKRMVDATTTHP